VPAPEPELRRVIYDHTLRRGRPPRIDEAAAALGAAPEAVRQAFQRLAEAHVLVLQPGSGEIRMANPFSAVPTPFAVRANGQAWFGNCIWDALGILAMTGAAGSVSTRCGCCGAEMRLDAPAVSPGAGVAHFALPARRWWDDIVFT
jgi:hypothetical protein